MSKIAYFDCFAGVSGDMIIASLLDSGLKFKDLRDAIGRLNIKGINLCSREVKRQGLRGKQFIVEAETAAPLRNPAAIKRCLNKSRLDSDTRENALKIFDLIAASEAKVHGIKKEEMHFHEIGACDTIVDVVGSLWGLKKLEIEEVYTSPLPLGSGFVSVLHGHLPVPAPATAQILKGYPVSGITSSGELTTPTGAAILSFLSKGCDMPSSWRIEKVGYGAGSRDTEVANLLRLFIGRKEGGLLRDEISVLETNIDNMDPQAYELVMERLFKAGALDVFLTNIIMKKGRPAHKLTVLSEKEKSDAIAEAVFKNTPTLGIRIYNAARKKLSRKVKSFKTPWGSIHVKEVKEIDGKIHRVPEADDVIRLARANSLSYEKIYKKILLSIF